MCYREAHKYIKRILQLIYLVPCFFYQAFYLFYPSKPQTLLRLHSLFHIPLFQQLLFQFFLCIYIVKPQRHSTEIWRTTSQFSSSSLGVLTSDPLMSLFFVFFVLFFLWLPRSSSSSLFFSSSFSSPFSGLFAFFQLGYATFTPSSSTRLKQPTCRVDQFALRQS